MVAAWINALTGVGPAIASGNQVCKGSWADLPKAPANKRAAMRVGWLPPRSNISGANAIMVGKSKVPSSRYNNNSPMAKAVSPTRVTTKALRAA